MTYLVLGVGDCVLADKLKLDELKQLICVGNALENRAQVLQSLVVADGGQGSKGVSLASGVALRVKEGLQQLGSVGHEGLVVLVDRGDGKDGILANVGMAVLQTGSCRG